MTISDATRTIMKSYLEKLNIILYKEISKDKIKTLIHLISVLETAISYHNLYEDKLSRWLGYVQGIMSVYGWVDVNDERNSTRELFHKAYVDSDMPIPESVSVKLNDVNFGIVSMQNFNDRAIKKYGVVSYKDLSETKINKIGMKIIKHTNPQLHKYLTQLDYDMEFVRTDGKRNYYFKFTNLKYKIV